MYQVYKIICLVNQKVYVGYTSKSADVRFKCHLDNAKWGRKTALYDAIRKYGNEAFSFEILQECSVHSEACEMEIKFIAEYGALIPGGYNMTTGGDGVPITPEAIKLASDKKRGRFTEAQKAAAERRKGRPLSEEHRAKLSASRKGVPKSEEWKEKIRISNLKRFSGKKRVRIKNKSKEEISEAARQSALKRWALERELQASGSSDVYWTPERRAERSRASSEWWTAERREAARMRVLKHNSEKLRNAALDDMITSSSCGTQFGACYG